MKPNSSSINSNVQVLEDASNIIFSEEYELESNQKPEIHINVDVFESKGISRIRYTLRLEDRIIDYEPEIELRKSEIKLLLKKFNKQILDFSRYRCKDINDQKCRLMNFAADCAIAFKKLIPDELHSEIQKLNASSWITISTNEAWIPWEILPQGKGFFSEGNLIIRLPRISNKNLDKSYKIEKVRIFPKSVKVDKVVHILSEEFSMKIPCKKILGVFPEHIKTENYSGKSFNEWLHQINQFDLIHFTCHGENNPPRLQTKKRKKNVDLDFQLDLLCNQEITLKHGCLVFANACYSSSPAKHATEKFVNFGWKFYEKGALWSIGILGEIPMDDALKFAEKFYNILVRNFKGDVLHSLLQTKVECGSLHCKLLYCLYGNPNFVRKYNFSSN